MISATRQDSRAPHQGSTAFDETAVPFGSQHLPAGLVGESDAFRRVMRRIARVAASDATVLVTGETGTGKELAARAIRDLSPRAKAPFIPINCGALPDHLLENELFGHARGAYTGADTAGKGLLAEAEGGTLFLDEINSLSLSAQAKLLRFLQSREYRSLGSTRLQHADVRIIAASNLDLRSAIDAGTFRADLYHRLHVLTVLLPPLRERREDVPLLAAHFLALFGKRYGRPGLALSEDAEEVLGAYDWPGNIRELQSVMERAVLLCASDRLSREDLGLDQVSVPPIRSGPPPLLPGDSEPPAAGPRPGASTLLSDVGLPASAVAESYREAKERAVREFERGYLLRVMGLAGGNVSAAAKLAGVQRRELQRLLRKHEGSGARFR